MKFNPSDYISKLDSPGCPMYKYKDEDFAICKDCKTKLKAKFSMGEAHWICDCGKTKVIGQVECFMNGNKIQ